MTSVYRPEIDGLRALAILPVLFYHADSETFSGGFVGVDVFFVISGYLITSIILRELANGTFKLRNFYARRAKRILPALFTMLTVSTIAAWWLLHPGDMAAFSASIASATALAVNF